MQGSKGKKNTFFKTFKVVENLTIDEEERNSGPALLMVVVCFGIAGCNLTQAV
jgi:hypothetical protein